MAREIEDLQNVKVREGVDGGAVPSSCRTGNSRSEVPASKQELVLVEFEFSTNSLDTLCTRFIHVPSF